MTTSLSGFFPRLLLIVAFLATQWSPVHYHIPQNHDHGGEVHIHELQIHSIHLAPRLDKLQLEKQLPGVSDHPGEPGVLHVETQFSSGSPKTGLIKTPAQSTALLRIFDAAEFRPFISSPHIADNPVWNDPETRPRSRAPPVTTLS